MPSNSLHHWQTSRLQALNEIAAAHAAVGGAGPGRRHATQQINQAYASLLSSQFQGYCRDLHSESVDHICRQGVSADPRLDLLRLRLTSGRKLDYGNPNPANLANDFLFFDLDLWKALEAHDAANRDRKKVLENLNLWRNAIAHQDFTKKELGGRTGVLLKDVRRWRANCERLAEDFDAVVGARLATIIGHNPW